ncbi:hypothetical protein KUV50_12940 [Membranicola marinus]|uniref:Viral A-type inclusion protein n=1 Tax=Membranihabitans marinus TaxID=1227546 RepID=A0A953HVK9_9BACT|nr:hypothetical protein [Membranihabitans marinus]MBY5959050.1 hypothetical protein [Membranihabitans marinus]
MTQKTLLFFSMAIWAVFACQGEKKSEAEIQYDLYYDSIMVIHDRTMPLMSKIEDLRGQLKKERKDVINSDPNTFRKINRLLGELNKAEDAMFDWMNGFKPDTVAEDQKLNYIKSQFSQVEHMEGLMLGGIGMAEDQLENKPAQ